ncbi:hypothetical protein A2W40_03370 [Candidatus Giovannonibacteria bacterium RIFCSPHIGHO2_01_45_12]|nr:MAG: hypothetical protein A2W40_03370 [Candidatus Giovannonibacteria bacterium RIFCSPHIGHO2_01_45_12]
MLFHLSREDGQQIPDELNTILLMATGQGVYRATGISLYDSGDGKPSFFTLGDDLELEVTESAERGIRDLASRLR